MKHFGTINYSSPGMTRRTGCRRSRRRSYTLEDAIMPKTCSHFEKEKLAVDERRSVFAGRMMFILCGLLFIGTGIYNVLF